MLVKKIQQRLAKEESGFTLIELLIVLVIIGILLAIAVPSYLGFKDRAENRAAASNVRAAIPAAEAFYADNGTYTGMNIAALQAIDQAVSLAAVTVNAGGTAYCLQSDSNGKTAGGSKPHKFDGPGGGAAGGVVAGSC